MMTHPAARTAALAALFALALGLTHAATTAAIDQTVEIRNVSPVAWQFTPQEIRISAGDSVTWVDRSASGSEPHTVTPDTPGAFTGSGILRPGNSHTVLFERVGEVAYHCDIHPSMTGRVLVAAAPSPTLTPSASPAPAQSTAATATQTATAAPISSPTPAPSASLAPSAPTPPALTPSLATTPSPSPAATSAAEPAAVPPAPDRGILPLAAILLAATLALLLGRRAYRRGR